MAVTWGGQKVPVGHYCLSWVPYHVYGWLVHHPTSEPVRLDYQNSGVFDAFSNEPTPPYANITVHRACSSRVLMLLDYYVMIM